MTKPSIRAAIEARGVIACLDAADQEVDSADAEALRSTARVLAERVVDFLEGRAVIELRRSDDDAA